MNSQEQLQSLLTALSALGQDTIRAIIGVRVALDEFELLQRRQQSISGSTVPEKAHQVFARLEHELSSKWAALKHVYSKREQVALEARRLAASLPAEEEHARRLMVFDAVKFALQELNARIARRFPRQQRLFPPIEVLAPSPAADPRLGRESPDRESWSGLWGAVSYVDRDGSPE